MAESVDDRGEPKERKPRSCDMHGHPWPPKYTTRGGGPKAPKAPIPTPKPRVSEAVSPPTIENRVAAVAAILVAVLYFIFCLSEPLSFLVTLPMFGYLGMLSVGTWRVRPRPRRGHVFFLWFLPILLQLSVYLLLTWRVALRVLAGDDHPLLDPLAKPLFFVAGILFATAWIPAVFLSAHCRRGGWLLAAETLGPLVVTLWFIAAATTLDD